MDKVIVALIHKRAREEPSLISSALSWSFAYKEGLSKKKYTWYSDDVKAD